jgi:hypothetical protein
LLEIRNIEKIREIKLINFFIFSRSFSAIQRGKGRPTVENSIAVVGVKKALLLGKNNDDFFRAK